MLSKPTSVYFFDLSNNIKELSDVRKEWQVWLDSYPIIFKVLINKLLCRFKFTIDLKSLNYIKCKIDVTFKGYMKMQLEPK